MVLLDVQMPEPFILLIVLALGMGTVLFFVSPQIVLLHRNKKAKQQLDSFLNNNRPDTLPKILNISLRSVSCSLSLDELFDKIEIENISSPSCTIHTLMNLGEFGVFISGMFNIKQTFEMRGTTNMALPELLPMFLLITKDNNGSILFSSAAIKNKLTSAFYIRLIDRIAAFVDSPHKMFLS